MSPSGEDSATSTVEKEYVSGSGPVIIMISYLEQSRTLGCANVEALDSSRLMHWFLVLL